MPVALQFMTTVAAAEDPPPPENERVGKEVWMPVPGSVQTTALTV
jgi:hypothetical protein